MHDRLCPVSSTNPDNCPFCEVIGAARGEEKDIFNTTWKTNLPLVTKRAYLEGYADSAAHRPPRYEGDK